MGKPRSSMRKGLGRGFTAVKDRELEASTPSCAHPWPLLGLRDREMKPLEGHTTVFWFPFLSAYHVLRTDSVS